jgi:hypothetical protein
MLWSGSRAPSPRVRGSEQECLHSSAGRREHDDYANAVAGGVEHVLGRRPADPEFVRTCLDMGSEVITPFASAPMATAGLRHSHGVSTDG